MKRYHIYLMANVARTVYTGVTADLHRRVLQHKRGLTPGFTTRYGLTRLVYLEEVADIRAAIAREKQIKAWTRAKWVALIEALNPEWEDLSAGWYEATDSSLRSE
jgi:putative endonuclease